MKFKKVLATITAATMVMASAMTVCAADHNLKGVREEVLVAGDVNLTNVSGDYSAESVRGAAITTTYEDVKESMGLTATQKPVVIMYDATDNTCPDAFVTLKDTEESTGANEVASIYIDLGAKEDNEWVSQDKINDATVKVKVGLPDNADRTKTYSVIRVQENGVATILSDLDTVDKTVTFEATTGVAVYGIVTDVTNAAVVTPVVSVLPVVEVETVETEDDVVEAVEAETEEADVEDAEAADAE